MAINQLFQRAFHDFPEQSQFHVLFNRLFELEKEHVNMVQSISNSILFLIRLGTLSTNQLLHPLNQ